MRSPYTTPYTPGSHRDLALRMQRADDGSGRFIERYFEFAFQPIVANTSETVRLQIMSLGSRFVRIVAMRGALLSTNKAFTGMELRQLMLRFQIGAENDLISDGQGNNVASLAVLFSGNPSPWLWFMSPPRARAGDTFQATITNTDLLENHATLGVSLTLRVIDDKVYRELYETPDDDDYQQPELPCPP